MSSPTNNRDIRELANLLDTKFRLPGGFRIGWDGIIGFVPVVGDIITSGMSFYIIARAAGLGCPPSVIARMAINVLIDNVLDVIPIVGNIFDLFWKSNVKNIELIENYLADPKATVQSSRLTVFFVLSLLILFMVALAYVGALIAIKIFALLQALFATNPSPPF